MRETTIKEERDFEAEYCDVKTVSASKHFVTVSSFYKIGEKVTHNMVLLTPEEAKKLRDALNAYIDDYKTEGIL